MWSEIIVFALAVVSHWQGYVTGGAITGLVALVERLFDWTMPKWAYGVLYLGVFLLVSFFLAWRDQYHEAQRVPVLQSQLEDRDHQISDLKNKPAQIQVNVPGTVVNLPSQMAYIEQSEIGIVDPKIGAPVAVTTTCKNSSTSIPAENVACWRHLEIVDTKFNSLNQPIVSEIVQDNAYSRFEKEVKRLKDPTRGTYTYGPGESHFGTVYAQAILDETLDHAFTAGTKTLLFTGAYDWKDGLSKHSNQICMWFQMVPGVKIGTPPVTLNSCNHHNGLKSH
jgi:hypothetical protein